MYTKTVFSVVLIGSVGLALAGCVDQGIFAREGVAFHQKVGELNAQEIKSSREIALKAKGTVEKADKKVDTKKDLKEGQDTLTQEVATETPAKFEKKKFTGYKSQDLGPLQSAPTTKIPAPDYGGTLQHEKDLKERQQQTEQEIFLGTRH